MQIDTTRPVLSDESYIAAFNPEPAESAHNDPKIRAALFHPKPKSIDITSATKKYTIVNMPTKIPISCHPNLFIYEYIVASC